MNCRNTYAQPPRRTRRWGSWLATAALALAFMGPATAQSSTAVIGTGTSTTNGTTADPVQRYYNYVHSQIVWTAAELSSAGMLGGSTITSMGFSISEAAASLANFTIEMGHTGQATATPMVSTGLSTVKNAFTYVPTVQVAGDFDMITFDNPFIWNGTDNLVVDICTGSNSFGSPYGGLRYTTAASGSINMYQRDGTTSCGLYTGGTSYTTRPNVQFDYNAPAGCTATTAPGATTGPSTACSGKNFDLGLTNVVNESGITYAWFVSTDGPGSGFNPVGGNTSSLTTSQTVESWYYCEVTCDQGTTETSTVLNVKMSAPNQCYCDVAGNNPADYITDFSTTGGTTNITNNGSGYSTDGYGDFTGMTVTQEQGDSVYFSSTYSTASTYGFKIWVDWNQDGDFDDPGETVFTSPGYSAGHTGTINVPVTATPGTTRMRIGNVWSPSSGPATACETSLRGEYEDYSFVVVAMPNCTGTPSPGNTTGPSMAMAGESFTLGLQNPTLGSGVTYLWEYDNGGGWTTFGGTTSSQITTLFGGVATSYRCTVTCDGNSATSTPIAVALDPTIQIGSGASADYQLPVNTLYNYSYTQQIYTAAELTAAGATAGLITKVRFLTPGAPTNWATNADWTMFMGNAGVVSFASSTSWIPLGSLTQVFSGTAPTPVAGTWMEITLSTPFVWDGSSNLVIAVDENAGSYSYVANQFATFDSAPPSGYRSLAYRSDGTNPDPAAPPAANNTHTDTRAQLRLEIHALMACSGTPDAGTVTGPANVCSGTTATLTATGLSTDSGISYQWEESADGSTWVPVTGGSGATTANYTTDALTVNTYFRVVTTCSNSGLSNESNGVLVAPFTDACECATYSSSYANNTTDEDITNVTVGTLNNSSTCQELAPGAGSIAGRYSNYAGHVAAPNLEQGSSIPFSLTQSCGTYSNGFQVYIDWDQDGVFDVSERVFNQPATVSGTHTQTGTFTVPMTAVLGNTRMRVVNVEFMTNTTNYAETSYGYGETEDYCVNVTAAPVCTGTPDAGTATGPGSAVCSGSTASLGATGLSTGTGIVYQWQESTDNTNWIDVTGGTGANTMNYTTGALTGNTYFRVTTTCSNSGQGNESSSVLVTVTGTVTYATYNGSTYSESFESWTNACDVNDRPGSSWTNDPETGNNSWRRNDQGGDAGWTTPTGGAYSPAASHGTYSARFHSYYASNGLQGKLDLYIDMSAGSGSDELSFDYINTSGSDNLSVWISEDGGSTFSQLGTTIGTASSWTGYTRPITSQSATTVIRFLATSDYGGSDIGLDNVQLTSPCTGMPSAGSITTPQSVCAGSTITLTAVGATAGPGIGYQWQQSPDGLANWTIVAGGSGASTTSYTTAAINDTSWFRLMVICSSGPDTAWSNVAQVNTAGAIYAVYNGSSYSESFESEWLDLCSTKDQPGLAWANTPAFGYNTWRRHDDNTSGGWQFTTGGGYTPVASDGSYSARFHSYGANNGMQGSLDLYIDMTAGTGNDQLSFDYININGSDNLGVWISTDGGATFSQLSTTIGTASSWTGYTRNITSQSATTVIRFQATSDYGSTDIGLDNVKIQSPCTGQPNAGAITTPQQVCAGSPAVLTASGLSAGLGITYQWEESPDGIGSWLDVVDGDDDDTDTYTTTGITTTRYFRIRTECISQMTNWSNAVEVSPMPAPVLSVSASDPAYCGGAAVTLTASGSDNYTWSPADGLDATTGATVNATPASTTTYTVTSVGSNGCEGSTTVTVNVDTPPTITSVTADPATVCPGTPTQLEVTTAAALSYCSSNFSSSSFEYISNVTMGAINNTTGHTVGGPVDYTSQVANVTVGTPISLSVTIAQADNDHIHAWVDWNQNGVLDDAGEEYILASGTSSAGPHTTTITPPANAVNGPTRIRVMVRYLTAPTPCNSASFGEAEDYTVNVSGGVDAYTYAWSPAGSLDDATIANPVATPTSSTNYTVTVTNAAGCSSQDNVSVTVDGLSVNLSITTDNAADELGWEFVDAANQSIESGSLTSADNNSVYTRSVCLSQSTAPAWFGFQLTDSGNDGITNGGWELRTTDGKLILRDAFDVASTSSPLVPGHTPSYGAYHTFALPIGPVDIHPDECEIWDNQADNKVYAVKQGGKNYQGATLNYQFEFINPDSGRVRRTKKPRNYVLWSELTNPDLVANVKYYARVRTDKSGPLTDAHWGAGCEMSMGAPDVCTGLIDDANNQYYSCGVGVERRFRPNSQIFAWPVYGATKYKFRIFNLGEGYDQEFISNNYKLELSWPVEVAPKLRNGYTYQVQVSALVNGVWTAYCASCPITINNNPSGHLVEVFGEATLWPNPARDGQVNLHIDGITSDVQHITVDVKDIYGQHVYGQEFENGGDRFTTVLDLPGDIATGIYLVNITVNGEVTTKRLSIVR